MARRLLVVAVSLAVSMVMVVGVASPVSADPDPGAQSDGGGTADVPADDAADGDEGAGSDDSGDEGSEPGSEMTVAGLFGEGGGEGGGMEVFADSVDTTSFTLDTPAARDIPFDFPEPRVLYTAGAFPVGYEPDSPLRWRQSAGLNVVKVVTADLDGNGFDDVVSLVNVYRESSSSFRRPTSAFLPRAVGDDGPTISEWYVVVQLVDKVADAPVMRPGMMVYALTGLSGRFGDLAVGNVAKNSAEDTYLDIVVSNAADQSITTLVNDGDGEFPTMVRTKTASDFTPDRTLVLGNFDDDSDGDGNESEFGGIDVAVASYQDDAVLVMSGNGDGTFGVGHRFTVSDVVNLAVIDLDHVAPLELVTTSLPIDPNSNAECVEEANPPMMWQYNTSATEGADAWEELPSLLPTDIPAIAAWVGDLDGDSFDDLALLEFHAGGCAGDAAQRLVPFRNPGAGSVGNQEVFVPQDPIDVEPIEIPAWGMGSEYLPRISGETVDVTADGDVDILMPGSLGMIGIAVGNGAAGFEELRTVAAAAGWYPEDPVSILNPGTALSVGAVTAGHFAGGDAMDLVVGTWQPDRYTAQGFQPGQLAVVPATAPGRFAVTTATAITGGPWGAGGVVETTVLTDWNDDEFRDIVFTRTNSAGVSEVFVAYGRQGGFGEADMVGDLGVQCASDLLVAHFDADSFADAACVGQFTDGGVTTDEVMLAKGNGAGGLGAAGSLGTLPIGIARSGRLFATDLNGDGLIDIAFTGAKKVADVKGHSLGWAKNKGDGTFVAPEELVSIDFVTDVPAGGAPVELSWNDYQLNQAVVADFDGDGLPDFTVAAKTRVNTNTNGNRLFIVMNATDTDAAPGGAAEFDDPVVTDGLLATSTYLGWTELEAIDVGEHTVGKPTIDLIVNAINGSHGDRSGTTQQLLLGHGDGTFSQGQTFTDDRAILVGLRAADLSGDGIADLVQPTAHRGVQFREANDDGNGHGDGTFGPPVVVGVPGWSMPWVELTDVDGNGTLDVIGRISDNTGPAHFGSPQVITNDLAILLNGGSTSGGGGDETCETEEPCESTPANLQAVSVEFTPAAGQSADPLTGITSGNLSITVQNTGTEAITGDWMDAVYLSRDGQVNAESILLAAVRRTEDLAGGASLATSPAVTIAPPAEGEWQLVLRADTRAELRDDDPSDNVATSPQTFTPVPLSVPDGQEPTTASYTAGEHGVALRIPSATFPMLLTFSSDAPSSALAVREGKMPTATVADQQITDGAGSITVLPGADRYVWVTLPKGETATLTLARTSFGIGSVRPRLAGNSGPVTFTVSGNGLGRTSRAAVIAPGGGTVPASTVTRNLDGTLSVTVDLTGADIGTYGIQVSDGIGESATTAALASAFGVVARPGGHVRISVNVPGSIRPNGGTIVVTFANDGLVDAVAPIIRVRTSGAFPVEGSAYPMGRFYVTPAIPGAPIGIIPAGTSGRINIPFMMKHEGHAPNGLTADELEGAGNGAAVVADLFGADSIAPYRAADDFARMVDELPDADFSDDDRAAIIAMLGQRFGTTGGTFLAGIHALRRGLAAAGAAIPTASFDVLLRYALSDVLASLPGATLYGTLDDSSGAPAPYQALRIETDEDVSKCPAADPLDPVGSTGSVDPACSRDTAIRTDAEGRWSMRGLPDGTKVRVFADGFGPEPLTAAEVETPVTEPLSLIIPDWTVVTGRVIQGADAQPVKLANVLIRPSAADPGSDDPAPDDPAAWASVRTDADGTYRFPGIAPGQYTITASTSDGRQVTGTLTVPEVAELVDAEDLRIAAQALVASGKVVNVVLGDDFDTEVSIKDAIVKVTSTKALEGVITATDTNGEFTAIGVGEGPWTVHVQAPGYATRWFDVDTTTPGVTQTSAGLRLGTIELGNEATVSGTVFDTAGAIKGAEVFDGMGNRTTTNASGHFELAGVARQSAVQLTAFREGYLDSSVTVDTSAGALSNADMTMELAAVLRVRVVQAGGDATPLGGVAVTVAVGSFTKTSVSDPDGQVWFRVPYGSTYTVTALGDGSTMVSLADGSAADRCAAGSGERCFEVTLERTRGTLAGTVPTSGIAGAPSRAGTPVWVVDGASLTPILTDESGAFTATGVGGKNVDLWLLDAYLGIRHAAATYPEDGSAGTATWAGGHTVSIDIALDTATKAVWTTGSSEPTEGDSGYVLPSIYLQPQAIADGSGTGGVPSVAGGDASMQLIPTGLGGDPVTWTASTAGSGILSVANVPPGDYRLTIVHADGSDDVTEFTIGEAALTVTSGIQAHVVASNTEMDGTAPRAWSMVELISKDVTPVRRYVMLTDEDGAWTTQVAPGSYTVNVYRSADDADVDALGIPATIDSMTFPVPQPFRSLGHSAFTSTAAVAPRGAPSTAASGFGMTMSVNSVSQGAVVAATFGAAPLTPQFSSYINPSYLGLPTVATRWFAAGDGPGGLSSIPPFAGTVDGAYMDNMPTSVSSDAAVDVAGMIDYPPASDDPCTVIDTTALSDARIAAHEAEQARHQLNTQLADLRAVYENKDLEAMTRAVVIAGEFAQAYLAATGMTQGAAASKATSALTAGKAAASGSSVDLSFDAAWKAITASGSLAGVQSVMSETKDIVENGMKLGDAIASGKGGGLSFSDAADAIAAAGPKVMGLFADKIRALNPSLGGAVSALGLITNLKNIATGTVDAKAAYDNANDILNIIAGNMELFKAEYEKKLTIAKDKLQHFKSVGFEVIELEDCDDEDEEVDDCEENPDQEDCQEGGSGGSGGGDEDDDSSGDSGDDPVTPKKPEGPKPGPDPKYGPKPVTQKTSLDPNEIIGPLGVGADRWVQADAPLNYEITFENVGPGTDPLHLPDWWDPDMINDIAPAWRVAVDMPLPEKADLDSVELGEFGFGIGTDAVTYRPDAGAQTFDDERPFHVVVAPRFEGDETELDLSLRAQAWLDRDPENPAVHWLLSLVDPETGVAHPNPDAGFLPPEPAEEDNEGAGQGFTNVAFRLSSEMATGDVVTASAGIVFDDNPEIMTEPWSNLLDRTAPSTSIDGSTQIPVGGYATIVPTDTGSGPGLVDVWRSVDGGPLVLWRYQVAPGSVVLNGEVDQVIGLAARASDRVGNLEDVPTAVQFTTTLVAASGGSDTGGSDSDGSGSNGSGSSGGSSGVAGDVEVLPSNADRVGALNRFGTAGLLAGLFGTADAVVIANGENYKQGFDALAANYLAGQVGAPILLTQADRLPPETLAALCSVLRDSTAATRTIYILGGTDSVSASVAVALSKPCTPMLGNVRVVRVGGGDRYATAAKIATGAFNGSGAGYSNGIGMFTLDGEKRLRTAIVASGEANADALSAGGIAAQFHLPMLLTAAEALPQATSNAVTALGIEQVIVLGGPDRVSQSVKGQLTALGVRNIVTIAGRDRFETSALLGTLARLATDAGGLGQDGSLVAIANGLTGFADALAAGPYLAQSGGTLLLSSPDTLPEALRKFLAAHHQRLTSVLALGGPSTISDAVLVAGLSTK